VQYAVVETDRQIVERLAANGVRAVVGDIADSSVLKAVALDRAGMLAFAIPDNLQLRHALEHVRTANPSLRIIARTHTADDANFLKAAGVSLVLVSERELGLQMAQFALHNLGISELAATETIERIRTTDV
jgi:CPA2 family monovalent cation:H+ antiporter-2